MATDEFEPSVTLHSRPGRVTADDLRELDRLRRAIEKALHGETVWVKNVGGAPIAAIVPQGIAEAGQAGWKEF